MSDLDLFFVDGESAELGSLFQRSGKVSLKESFVEVESSGELNLWGEVLLRAVSDFKEYMACRKDPIAHPLSTDRFRLIVGEGCDPEYWIFAKDTGFDAVCLVLNIEPDCIRRFLRNWLSKTLDMESSY